jgi:hypothetical protein
MIYDSPLQLTIYTQATSTASLPLFLSFAQTDDRSYHQFAGGVNAVLKQRY